ncbi:MAG: glycosyltransferase [Planctomycetota bacterium]|nr:glycosyltransferase [Planctomycetota bacterium]
MLPVYGEGAHGTEVAAQVSAFAIEQPEFEFLFVNDGSRDDTAERVSAGIDRRVVDRVRVRSYGINGGKGWAVLRGVAELCEAARDDDAIIFTDGDLAYSLDHLLDLARALEGADVAIGSRREEGGEVGAHTARRWMGWLFNRMARWVVGWPCRDTQAGLKGFRASAARRIFAAVRETGFAFDVELLHIARRLGYRVAEVPARVSSFHRHIGSSVNLLRDPLRMVRSLARVSVNGALGVYERAAEGRQPIACVSFDAEEFDIPREFGAEVSAEDQFTVAAEGMRRALAVMDEIPARATFFCTAAFASACPELISTAVDRGHEIASHGRVHTGFTTADLEISRRELERLSGQAVRGFRRPRFERTPTGDLLAAGYAYDSSVHPAWIPGRYNGLGEPRVPTVEMSGREPSEALVRIPASVSPRLRVPTFWLAFKNFPKWLTRWTWRRCLKRDGHVQLVFHPWELCENLARFGLPWYVRRLDGDALTRRMVGELRWLSRRARLVTYGELADRVRAAKGPADGPAKGGGNGSAA